MAPGALTIGPGTVAAIKKAGNYDNMANIIW